MAKAKVGAKKAVKSSAKKSKSPQKKALKRVATKNITAKKSVPKKSAKKVAPKRPAKRASGPREKLVFGTIEQIEHFSAAPEVVYRALVEGKLHEAFTGAVAKIASKVGGAFTAWGGYIRGKFVELVPGEKIVQAWRTTDFPSGYPDSNLVINLTPESGGTRLRLFQTNVPEKRIESFHSGWHDHYWQPLRAWLSTLPDLDLPLRKKSKSKKATKRR